MSPDEHFQAGIMSVEGGTKAVVAALLANTGIAIAKLVAFFFTRSSSMLAEAFHSFADAANQALLLVGVKRAKRAATPLHPFGYGRERFIYSFIVAIVLFSLGGLFALYEGWHKVEHALSHPDERMEKAEWAFGVLIIAILLEIWSFRTAIVESNKVRGNRSWWQFIRRSKAPELPVVLLEDLGALVGLFLALGGVTLAVVTENLVWDGIGTLCIGVLLAVIAVILAIETKSLLLGEGASPEDVRSIERALLAESSVSRIIHMRTLYLGPEELLVGAKIAVEGTSSAGSVAEAINAAETRVRDAVPLARVIYLEPDVYRAEAAGASPVAGAVH